MAWWLIPAFPYLGAMILILAGGRLSKPAAGIIGCGSMGLSALLTIITGVAFISGKGEPLTLRLWEWFDVAGWSPGITLYLDSLSLVFTFVITFVGFLIHVYSTGYMAKDEGFTRFFAYLNLFVGSMLMLVLADNLLLMYLGWEGVGLCSFLLIGFWYKDPVNGAAAQKAFIVTRIGDTAFAIGLFMLFQAFGTLNIREILSGTEGVWPAAASPTVIALLLLGGAVGKSAQLPLQTWLPDAMAGPTPVSALIHAATMVTAGVYLIARMHPIFELSPAAMSTVALIGALTLLIAGFSALCQRDLKRVLAYSTISQIGYMFLALGLGAWTAAIFHFFTHAFFKALLFLGAGAVIEALHHEQDMFKMGGLRKELPVVYWTFLAGSASLAALPLITAGFYSKDQIVWLAFAGENGSTWLWLAALTGAFLTAIYTFRMVFITFWGEVKTAVSHHPGKAMTVPLLILAFFSIFAGFIELPHNLGHITLFSGFLNTVLPVSHSVRESIALEWLSQGIAAILTFGGIYISWLFFIRKPQLLPGLDKSTRGLQRLFHSGWAFDQLYGALLVRPYKWLAAINREDITDKFYTSLASFSFWLNRQFIQTQTGILRQYILGAAIGALIILTISILA
ncbi:NADH dehydrogenase subunit L [Anseongella ginsenosidimutans]|uniref:NADH dehydrogenase subunit L n=1 Tax=Anseongella ginsenosidimutans TaxID=496056 RepID=A0A4R3KRC9_9SPHI|nr:NADH-quinone oxidoreductase subunit L [Anseongella ginsenosidimutans]QEC52278.1 NADH-quinone oxidoreductase subunit L [Anseongella ginsenosidimutans]TCS86835.1 NADH dehydrogenase subunit L [Anseongella ginsenosidimutans]